MTNFENIIRSPEMLATFLCREDIDEVKCVPGVGCKDCTALLDWLKSKVKTNNADNNADYKNYIDADKFLEKLKVAMRNNYDAERTCRDTEEAYRCCQEVVRKMQNERM